MPNEIEARRQSCLNLLYLATTHVRSLAWSGSGSIRTRLSRSHQEQIADLMNAVHNLPLLLINLDKLDEARLREDLQKYDEKWSGVYPLKLLDSYEKGLAGDFSSY